MKSLAKVAGINLLILAAYTALSLGGKSVRATDFILPHISHLIVIIIYGIIDTAASKKLNLTGVYALTFFLVLTCGSLICSF